mmetsp:Transcript_38770/g.95407  ORF Transcript_38770/g.95407 Transcript_38770/m.95407 type:complete len:80 (-) Transcript_38770:59-298(-)
MQQLTFTRQQSKATHGAHCACSRARALMRAMHGLQTLAKTHQNQPIAAPPLLLCVRASAAHTACARTQRKQRHLIKSTP